MKPKVGMPTDAKGEILAAAASLRRNCFRIGLRIAKEANMIAIGCAFFQRNTDTEADVSLFRRCVSFIQEPLDRLKCLKSVFLQQNHMRPFTDFNPAAVGGSCQGSEEVLG